MCAVRFAGWKHQVLDSCIADIAWLLNVTIKVVLEGKAHRRVAWARVHGLRT